MKHYKFPQAREKIAIIFLFLSSLCSAQQFTETFSVLKGVGIGQAIFADYNNDGYLDIFLFGTSEISDRPIVYKNINGDGFEEQNYIFSSSLDGTVADIDNDGDLDILYNYDKVAIWKNNSGLGFALLSNHGAQGFLESPVNCIDYDNDGDLDIHANYLNRNDGSDTFIYSNLNLPTSYLGSTIWADFDNDGDLDLLVSGSDGPGVGYSAHYEMNDGDGDFIDKTDESFQFLPAVGQSSFAAGDYDNDGDLDILYTGRSQEEGDPMDTRYSIIYRNNGDGSFSEQTDILLPKVENSSVAWGDYDNDGDLDILISGATDLNTYVSQIYKNNGDNSFSEQTNISLTGISHGSAAWGDYDNDGDLDILLSGGDGNACISKIYRNNSATANTAPTAPTNLLATVNDNYITFSWDKSTDTETPQNGLTYNLYIGTTNGGVEIMPPMSNTENGFRKIVGIGNAGHRNSYTIKLLTAGTYYWGVQAIDSGFKGSAFANGESFSVSPTFTNQTSISLTAVYHSSVAWGDYDNDGDLDILITGETESARVSKIYQNNGDNTFIEQAGISLTGVSYGSTAWGDYDNDGDLDIFLAGFNGSSRVSKIYKNNGENTFAEQNGISLIGVSHGSAEWGDYDNDGDLDILICGSTGSSCVSKIYKNNGDNTFAEQSGISLTGVSDGSAAWGDYDDDGDLDVLLTGYPFGQYISKIYKNNGNNTFTEQTSISLTGVSYSSVAWGDYDNDGDLDLLFIGNTWNPSSRVSKIYKNNGDNTFTEQSGITLTGVSNGSIAWGDYDNDGYLDILLTGETEDLKISKIYKNNGDNTFTEKSSIALTEVSRGSVAWGDYDNDGDLDILLTGEERAENVSKIYKNNTTTANTAPASPTNLSTSVNGSSVTFSWNKSTDTETSQNGLTYNLYIGSTNGGVEKLSPMANLTNGYRRIVQIGNTGNRNSYTINGLTEGTYFWGVQAVDAGFKGSSFATMSSPLPVELTSFKCCEKNGKVELRWSTATEVNNYGFEILRFAQNDNWEKIGFVQGHGNSNSPKDYFFVDNNCPCGIIKYRLKQIDLDGSFEYSPEIQISIDAPKSLSLDQNYPNPFNPATTIKFTLPGYDFSPVSAPMRVTLKVYDILGREIRTIVDEFLPPGYYSYSINAAEMNLTSGVYFYKLTAGELSSVKKMVLMK